MTRIKTTGGDDNDLMPFQGLDELAFTRLLDLDPARSLSHGAVLRVQGAWPHEALVDLLVCNVPQTGYGMTLLVATGYKASLLLQTLPIESGYPALSINWLITNWPHWVYPTCPVDQVFVAEGYPAPSEVITANPYLAPKASRFPHLDLVMPKTRKGRGSRADRVRFKHRGTSPHPRRGIDAPER